MAQPAELMQFIAAAARANGGTITFARFMEIALYQPGVGYYTSTHRPRIGREGDFITSPTVGAVFGRILARQFEAFRDEATSPAAFEIVEFGGHRGQLRQDVLSALPDLRYRIIEAGDEIPDQISGCVFANELLDALPVHRVRVDDGQWKEIYVNESLEESFGPLSTPRLVQSLADLPADRMEGYTTEINLSALDWLDDVARRLVDGFIMIIDYGFERADFFSPERRDGTLQCYFHHTRHVNPYMNLGEQDITSHVEFTSLIDRANLLGLELVQFTDQGRYLTDIGEPIIAEIVAENAGKPSAERNAVHQLIHPALMGRVFRVLVLRK